LFFQFKKYLSLWSFVNSGLFFRNMDALKMNLLEIENFFEICFYFPAYRMIIYFFFYYFGILILFTIMFYSFCRVIFKLFTVFVLIRYTSLINEKKMELLKWKHKSSYRKIQISMSNYLKREFFNSSSLKVYRLLNQPTNSFLWIKILRVKILILVKIEILFIKSFFLKEHLKNLILNYQKAKYGASVQLWLKDPQDLLELNLNVKNKKHYQSKSQKKQKLEVLLYNINERKFI
jgi:hypothetical protein